MTELGGFKFATTLAVIEFEKIESGDVKKYTTFHSKSKSETIINESDVDDVFESIYTAIISSIQKYIGKGLGWIIDSVVSHAISISNYNPLVGRSYIKVAKELDHPRKGLNDIHSINHNECFKWCWLRYVHPTDHKPIAIRKVEKLYGDKLDFKDKKFPVKVIDVHKIERINSLRICVMKIRKKYPIFMSKKCCKGKHVD